MLVSIIIPVLNEEESIPAFIEKIKTVLPILNGTSIELIFIDDGSTDNSFSVIQHAHSTESSISIKALRLSRNFGKEYALFAGLDYANGDAIIPVDVDLQDPIELIPEMIKKWKDGFDIVLAKRTDRSSDSIAKRVSAEYFYKIHNHLSSIKIEENSGDFRLISKKISHRIRAMGEVNLFMKGMFAWPGGKTAIIEYTRPPRQLGHSKFNAWKLWNLAIDGITNFSSAPLKIWTYIGFIIGTISFLYGAWLIIDKIIWGNPIHGYSSIMVSILFLGSIQLIGIGVLGEYLGRVYMETKKRPRYIIEDDVGFHLEN